MKKIIIAVLAVITFVGCNNTQTSKKETIAVTYPSTKKVDTVTNYFGTDVKDPYRWLEDDMSQETGAWVKTQNVTTNSYLENIPFREELKERLITLWNYEKVGAPFIEGDYSYFYKNEQLEKKVI